MIPEAIAKQIDANQEKLESCIYHNFARVDSPPWSSHTLVCTNCGGYASDLAVKWYNIGREHEELKNNFRPAIECSWCLSTIRPKQATVHSGGSIFHQECLEELHRLEEEYNRENH